ncbi:hypothetical protein DPMN_070235 [Dreissena polymorpha]|uniref:Uncharacterized protein n=1 Tax=Dreissena polymorpha TaxID=45954 RepID=A0A9D3Z4P9_DREPO|nr:hypothetical protein DPMN_070235 [Dreissena polymorpha]
MTWKAIQTALRGLFLLMSAYTASSYQEDPEIQILLDQADSSILRGKTYASCSDI